MLYEVIVRDQKYLLMGFLLLSSVLAQEHHSIDLNDKQGFGHYFVDGIYHTVTMRENQWMLGIGALSMIYLKEFDLSFQEFSQENGLIPNKLSRVLDLYGGGFAYPVALVAIGVYSYHRKGQYWEEISPKIKYVATAISTTGALTSLIKQISHRQRPNKRRYFSFPSGHTSSSFALATTLHELYGRNIGVPAYIIAAFVGLQRIHDNKHWLTDVIAGAALGTIIGRGFGKAYQKEVTNSRMTIHTEIGGGGIRLMLLLSI